MMSHLHAGPRVAARGVDAAEVTFLVRGSVSADTPASPNAEPCMRDPGPGAPFAWHHVPKFGARVRKSCGTAFVSAEESRGTGPFGAHVFRRLNRALAHGYLLGRSESCCTAWVSSSESCMQLNAQSNSWGFGRARL